MNNTMATPTSPEFKKFKKAVNRKYDLSGKASSRAATKALHKQMKKAGRRDYEMESETKQK